MQDDWVPSVVSSSRGNSPQDPGLRTSPRRQQPRNQPYPSLHDSRGWVPIANSSARGIPPSPLKFVSPLRPSEFPRRELVPTGGATHCEALGNEFLASSLCETPLPVMAPPAGFSTNVTDSGGGSGGLRRGGSRRSSGGDRVPSHVTFGNNNSSDGFLHRDPPRNREESVGYNKVGDAEDSRRLNCAFGGAIAAGRNSPPGSSASPSKDGSASEAEQEVGQRRGAAGSRGAFGARPTNGNKGLLADSAWIKRKSMQGAADAAALFNRRRPETAPSGEGSMAGAAGVGGSRETASPRPKRGNEREPAEDGRLLFGSDGGSTMTDSQWMNGNRDNSLLFLEPSSDESTSRGGLDGSSRRRKVAAAASGADFCRPVSAGSGGGKEFLTPFSAAAGRRASALRGDDGRQSPPKQHQQLRKSRITATPAGGDQPSPPADERTGYICWVAVSGFRVAQWPKVKAALEPVTGPIDAWTLTDGEIHGIGFRNHSAAQKCVVLSGCRAARVTLFAAWPASILFDPPEHSIIAAHGKQPERNSFTGRPNFAAQPPQNVSRHSYGEFGQPYDTGNPKHAQVYRPMTFTGHSSIPSVALSFVTSLFSFKEIFSPFLVR